MTLLHLSANLQAIKVTYQDNSDFWEDVIFYTFFAGVNYNDQEGGNTYLHEIYGFLVILILCVLERKSEIWLTNKLGYVGSKYDTKEGRFKLERYASEVPKLNKKISSAKEKTEELEIIEEDEEDDLEELKAVKLKVNY